MMLIFRRRRWSRSWSRSRHRCGRRGWRGNRLIGLLRFLPGIFAAGKLQIALEAAGGKRSKQSDGQYNAFISHNHLFLAALMAALTRAGAVPPKLTRLST